MQIHENDGNYEIAWLLISGLLQASNMDIEIFLKRDLDHDILYKYNQIPW